MQDVATGQQNSIGAGALWDKEWKAYGENYGTSAEALYDAVRRTDEKLTAAYNAEAVEGNAYTPIINAVTAAGEDVRQETVSPMAAAEYLSTVYAEKGEQGLMEIVNPRNGNLYDNALEAIKKIDTEHGFPQNTEKDADSTSDGPASLAGTLDTVVQSASDTTVPQSTQIVNTRNEAVKPKETLYREIGLNECVDSEGNYIRITEMPPDNAKSGFTVQDGVTAMPGDISNATVSQHAENVNTQNVGGTSTPQSDIYGTSAVRYNVGGVAKTLPVTWSVRTISDDPIAQIYSIKMKAERPILRENATDNRSRFSSYEAFDDSASSNSVSPQGTNVKSEAVPEGAVAPREGQTINALVSNIVNAAKKAGIDTRAFYEATANINAFQMRKADVAAIAATITPIVNELNDSVYYGYLEKLNSYMPSTQQSDIYGTSVGAAKQQTGPMADTQAKALTQNIKLTEEQRAAFRLLFSAFLSISCAYIQHYNV